MIFNHKPILLAECMASLNIQRDGTYLDLTLGGAGHASEILKRLGPKGLLVGIDQDENAIAAADQKLNDSHCVASYKLHRTNFENITSVMQEMGINAVQGILMDLGVSSHQLDEAERGFSYQHDAPLDMRMDRRNALSAREVMNTWSHGEITRIIREYGEDRWASRIASFIVKARETENIETTGQLVEIIKAAVPASARREGPHPAKRTFQAIRIAVNRELDVLASTLNDAVMLLVPGGRIAVITFHSLEDRIVKQTFASFVDGCTCPKNLPVCVCGFQQKLKLVTRKPIEAGEVELQENPRARSAKLRVAEKINHDTDIKAT